MTMGSKISAEQRRRMIAEAAYYRAEKRGFGVNPVADWMEAESEVDRRLHEIENARLLELLENGLEAAAERVATLRKKLRRTAAGARVEWRDDVERLGELRDALRSKLKDLRTQGERASDRARRQAEKIWNEINHTMQRVAERVQH